MADAVDREALLAAGLQLEQEIDRAIASFAQEHGALLRKACQVEATVPLDPVVLTTFFGHLVTRMRKLHGRAQTERVAEVLLDQVEHAEQRAAALRGETRLPKEAVH